MRTFCNSPMNHRIGVGLLAAVALSTAGSLRAQATIRVAPDTFWNTLDHRHPVLARIKPGDIVVTQTIDAAGYDLHGKQRAAGSNPMTGPFFVEGAEPGDAIVITFRKVRLNRTTAYTAYRLGQYAVTGDLLE